MPRIQDIPIERVMTMGPTCVDHGCTLSAALAFLVRERYQSAPVVDHTGQITGLVTRNGLLSCLCGAPAGGGERTLREASLQGPPGRVVERALRFPAEKRLEDVARALVEADAPACLVTRDEEVVGILTLLDCVRALAYGEQPVRSRGRGHCFSPDGSSEGDETERSLESSPG